MKKTVLICLSVLLFLMLLSGCSVKQADVWDGSVATSFGGGAGTETDPYKIATAAQLAYLAQQVNAGNQYEGQFFKVTNDLDLNDLEWTPIGNGTYDFSGVFDGGEHSIVNLKITNGVSFVGEYTWGREHNRYTTGLFGSCMNSVIKNLTIDQAEIIVQNTVDRDVVCAGVLVGDMEADTYSEISNVKVSNAEIIGNFKQDKLMDELRIGGVAGWFYGNEEASCEISQTQSDVRVSIANGRAGDNFVGGSIGTLYVKNVCHVTDCNSSLAVEVATDDCYNVGTYFGACGSLSGRKGAVALTNIFSKVAVNKIYDCYHDTPEHMINAVAGQINPGVVENGGYKFENVFGFVDQNDASTGKHETSMQLYEIPYDEIYTETNCKGCKSLPENHGFDTEIWDVSDPANPKLK